MNVVKRFVHFESQSWLLAPGFSIVMHEARVKFFYIATLAVVKTCSSSCAFTVLSSSYLAFFPLSTASSTCSYLLMTPFLPFSASNIITGRYCDTWQRHFSDFFHLQFVEIRQAVFKPACGFLGELGPKVRSHASQTWDMTGGFNFELRL